MTARRRSPLKGTLTQTLGGVTVAAEGIVTARLDALLTESEQTARRALQAQPDGVNAHQIRAALDFIAQTRSTLHDHPELEAALYAAWQPNARRLIKLARAGGYGRGRQKTLAAQQHDARIVQLAERWRSSDELQARHRSLTSYISRHTGLHVRTVRRALKRLSLA
jgi:hypothetical protein